MALIIADRVQETSTTTGNLAYTLLGATTGYRAASTVCANGDTFTYYAEDIDASGRPLGGWETGDVLERTIEYVDSNSNLKTVSKFTDLPNEYYDITKYTAPQAQEKLFYIHVNYYDEALLETKTVANCLTVHYNYTSSNQSLKDAAKKVLV